MAFWNRKKKQSKNRQENAEQPSERLETQIEEAEGSEDLIPETVTLEQEELSPIHHADQKRFVKDCCESIAEGEIQIQKSKQEYEQVTEYLTDIQKIDRIEGESRSNLLAFCQKISRLLKERNQYKNREITIPDTQVRRFDRYQEDLIDEIKKMYQTEMRQKAIESDIKHLEEEKVSLRQNQREIVEKQNALKGMAKILIVLIVSLMILFVVIYYTLQVNMTYPYMGTLILAAVSSTVIFMESNKNRHDIAWTDRKINKAIGLLNRTKIKYINNKSVLDYDRQKFNVKNAADFEALWGEYCKAKEYERVFRENTEQLNHSNEELLILLKEYQVSDPDVWLIQTYAILDNREMVEIRHELNERRQKLREQIEYNTRLKEELLAKIDNMIQQNPDRKEVLLKVIREFNNNSKKVLDTE